MPKFLGAPRFSPRAWLCLAAAVGAAVCGYAGLYPRFDGGSLRVVLALTSAPFAAAVVASALSAKTGTRALASTLGLSALLGVASTILPAAILSFGKNGDNFIACCIFGVFFGAPTGALYGMPLGVLAMTGHRHVAGGTHEGTDRASRAAGIWLVAVALVALAGTRGLDEGTMDWATQKLIPPSPLPAILALAAVALGIAMIARSFVRMARRSAWLGRVRDGLEPAFRLRPVELRDQLAGLPRFGDTVATRGVVPEASPLDRTTTVLEWVPDEIADASTGTAYRVAASGRPVAIVRDVF